MTGYFLLELLDILLKIKKIKSTYFDFAQCDCADNRVVFKAYLRYVS